MTLIWLLLFAASPGLADWQTGLDAFKSGDLSAAEQQFRQVTEQKPDWYGGHRMLGQVLLRLDRPADALRSLQKANDLAPADAATRLDLGRAALAMDHSKQALEVLSGQRPDTIPDALWIQWLRYRAEAARQADNLGSARADLESLVPLQPKDASLRYLLSTVTQKMGDLEAAREYLDQAFATKPSHAPYLAKRLMLDLNLAASEKQPEQRQTLCSKLTQDTSRLVAMEASAKYLNLAGRIESCAGLAEAAVGSYSKAVAKGANDWATSYRLARQQTLSGTPDDAIETLTSILGKAAGDQIAKTHDELGYAYQLENQFDKAIDHYSRAGSQDRLAKAKAARSVHMANLEEEQRHQRELELLKKLKELEQAQRATVTGEL